MDTHINMIKPSQNASINYASSTNFESFHEEEFLKVFVDGVLANCLPDFSCKLYK